MQVTEEVQNKEKEKNQEGDKKEDKEDNKENSQGVEEDKVPEEDATRNQANHEQQLMDLVDGLDADTHKRLALELLRRHAATFADIVNVELAIGDGQPSPSPPPGNSVPDWHKCGHCVGMPTQEENKCCPRSVQPCISRSSLFHQLGLGANVLDIAMRYWEDVLVLNNARKNENFRHAAYRQYVLWQHGH